MGKTKKKTPSKRKPLPKRSALYSIGQRLAVKGSVKLFIVGSREWSHNNWWYRDEWAPSWRLAEHVLTPYREARVVEPERAAAKLPALCGLSILGSKDPPCDQPVVGVRDGVKVCEKHLDPKSGALPGTKPPKPDSQKEIAEICDAVKAMLLEKNRAYGDSALDPVRIFSKADPVEQIRVRLDDKLSRLARGSAAGEDVISDLLGYLVLLKIAMNRKNADAVKASVMQAILSGGAIASMAGLAYQYMKMTKDGTEVPGHWEPFKAEGSFTVDAAPQKAAAGG